MTNVIEFYVPVRFRKTVKWVHQQQRGRVLEFRWRKSEPSDIR